MTTTEATMAERDLVVHDPRIASGLVSAGIPATTYSAILADSDIANMTHLAGEPVVLVVDEQSLRKAAVVAVRLRRLALPFIAIAEFFDRRPS